MKFVDWLARRLHAAGTRRAFGVPGGGNSLDLIVALRAVGIDTVVTAREDAAIMMAGISGVLGESPGVAFTTKGPGLASGSNGLAAAALDRMPTLLVTESFEPGELEFLSHQVYDQAELVAPFLAKADSEIVQPTVGGIEAWLEGALGTPYRPGVMLPTSRDYANEVTDPAVGSPGTPAGLHGMQSIEPPAPDLDAARSALARARRPVVVIGLGAARSDVTDPLRALVDTLGAPVLCTYMAKGCVPDDAPQFAGIFTGGAIEQPCVIESDLIVLIGLDPVELIRKPWPYEIPVLELTETIHSPHYMVPEYRVIGRLANTLAALDSQAGETEWTSAEIAAHRSRFIDGMTVPTTPGTADAPGVGSSDTVMFTAQAFTAHRPVLPRLAVDAGAHMFSACAFWPCATERDLLISNGLATMGFALPAGLAAALHDPSRGAVAMTGDGGLLMCLGELKTAAEMQANLTVIVFNDGRLSLIDIKRQERQMSDLGMSWERPDFAAVARGFGLRAWQARDVRGLEDALGEAINLPGPKLVDVWIDSGGYPEQLRALRG